MSLSVSFRFASSSSTIGNKLISHIDSRLSSQDILDAKEVIKNMLNEIEREQTAVCISWNELEKCLEDAREFTHLEEGVSYVTNWILTTAESLLNGQLKVGYDVQSAEKLRLDHEILEFQCWKTYGFYGELLYKIDNCKSGSKETFAYKDLSSQRDFMDFVCRSFANRLERRRNLLITSVRFYRLVAEYFQRTSNVFESLLETQKTNVDSFELANVKLQKIKHSQQSLGENRFDGFVWVRFVIFVIEIRRKCREGIGERGREAQRHSVHANQRRFGP